MHNLSKARRNELIERLAKRMKEDAETGLSTRIINQINFKSLAVSAILELEQEIVQ